jgi:GH35 family endo-1,4-beta-xylanase
MVASLLVFGSLFLSCVARKPALAERQWGINIHFEEEQPGEIQQLSHSYAISRIGATWDRIEQIKGEYNFSMYDDLYTGLHSHNVRPYWLLAFGNVHYTGWLCLTHNVCVQTSSMLVGLRPSPCTLAGDRMMPPTTDVQRTAFANYVAATMTHFKGRNITWELFNEPNSKHSYARSILSQGSCALHS